MCQRATAAGTVVNVGSRWGARMCDDAHPGRERATYMQLSHMTEPVTGWPAGTVLLHVIGPDIAE